MANAKTHKVITTKKVNSITGTTYTTREYRGVKLIKRTNGTFVFVRYTYGAGIGANSWFYGGGHTLKDAVAQIDAALDNDACVVEHRSIYTREAFDYMVAQKNDGRRAMGVQA